MVKNDLGTSPDSIPTGKKKKTKSKTKTKRSGAEKRRDRRQKESGDGDVATAGAELELNFQFGASDLDEIPSSEAATGTNSEEQSKSPSRDRSDTKSDAAAERTKTQKRKEARKKRKDQKKAADRAAKAESTEDPKTDPPLEALPNVDVPSKLPPSSNGLAEGDDFISLSFDDSAAEEVEDVDEDSDDGKPAVFAKVAAKLGKFVQESNDPLKRKRNEEGDSRQTRKRKREVAKVDPYPWLRGVSYAHEREPSRILHQEMLDFVKFVGPTEKEHRVRTFVISRIRKLVEKKWPTASLRVFGSFETKLYLPTSDIDLVVLSDPDEEIYEKPNHLRRLANWLVKARIAENIQVITSARVPIIKFIDSVTKINVDISFNKPSGLVAARVVQHYTESMPALRALVVFIKHFLNMRGLNEVYLGGLGSYSIICMVVSFLQRHPKVATGQILQQENLGVLVVEFFELYGKRFNYDNVGINIGDNGKYFSKVEYGWQRPGQSYLLSIQDPTDLENDIAKSSFGILKVKSTLGGGHDFLVQRLYDVNDRIKDRKRADTGLDSILSAVVSIDEDMKEGRAFIESCFDFDVVQEELERMDESEGEIHEVPSFDPTKLTQKRTKKQVGHRTSAEFIAEDESDDDDIELIDNDGHAFVRPDGYRKPSNPGDVDDLYAKLNTAPVHPPLSAPTRRLSMGEKAASNGAGNGDQVYLIDSSDDEAHRHKKSTSSEDVINLDSDEAEDSKVAQVDKGARARYWEAKGKEAASLVDDYDSASGSEHD